MQWGIALGPLVLFLTKILVLTGSPRLILSGYELFEVGWLVLSSGLISVAISSLLFII